MNNKKVLDNLVKVIKSLETEDKNYDLESLFNNMDYTNSFYSETINEILLNIKEKCDVRNIDDIQGFINDRTEYFRYATRNNINYLYFDSLCEEANSVTMDLISKIFNYNGRSFNLPVNIDNIVDYSITSYIKDYDITKVIMWITLELVIVNTYI